MVDPDPIHGDDPYEILGVTRMDSMADIESAVNDLVREYQLAVKEAKRKKNGPEFRESQEALDAIEEAWEWMEKNHVPPVVDGPASITVDSSQVEVGTPLTVQVTENGAAISDAKVMVDREAVASKQTDTNGEVTFTFGQPGKTQITVPTTDAYADATANVDISRRSVDLSFYSPQKSVEVNDKVEFTVVGDSGPEPGVVVEIDGSRIGKTGSDGTVTHSFRTTGRKTVTVRKADDDAVTYEGCEHDIEVGPETVELTIRVLGNRFEIGDDVEVEVTASDGTPVEGAEVTVGDESTTTDTNGRATAPVTLEGSVTISATKSAPDQPRTYEEGTAEIHVSKRQGTLQITKEHGELMEKRDLRFQVVDGNGDPLSGATVTTNWGHSESTDDSGEVTIPLDNYGDLHVIASKTTENVDYGEDALNLHIEEFTRELRIDECPKTADPGENIDIRVTDTTGTPVPDAEIRCDGQPGEVWSTDSDGRVTVPLRNRVGVRKIWVMKDDGDFDAEEDQNVHVIE